MPKPAKKLTLKQEQEDESENDACEYMRPVTPSRIAYDPNEDDPPSIEKHGFWMFPRRPYEKIGSNKNRTWKGSNPRSPNDQDSSGPSSAEEEPAERQFQPQINPKRMQQPRCPPFRPIATMGCQCFCHIPPCCPCRFWMNQTPTKLFGMMPFAKFQSRSSQNARSPNAWSTRNQPANKMTTSRMKRANKSAANSMIDYEGRKDMELASIMVNDAKSSFKRAISEQHLKDELDLRRNGNKPEIRSLANKPMTSGNDAWQLNKATENFGKFVKEENDVNVKLRLKNTVDRNGDLEYEDSENSKPGRERLYTGKSTLLVNKSNENFRINVKDAQAEIEQLNKKPTESHQKHDFLSRIRHRTKKSKGKR